MGGSKTRSMKAWQKDEAQRILQEMQSRHPVFFGQGGGKPVPGRIGIAEDIEAAAPEGVPPEAMQRFRRFWFGLPDYVDALTRGGPRYRLDGSVEGEVTPEDVEAAVRKLALMLFEGMNSNDPGRRKRADGHRKRLNPTKAVRQEIDRLADRARAEGRAVIWPAARAKGDAVDPAIPTAA